MFYNFIIENNMAVVYFVDYKNYFITTSTLSRFYSIHIFLQHK